jgi:cytochrome c oxidase subunit 4
MLEHHIIPKSIYIFIFAALLAFTILTRLLAGVDLGQWNIIVAFTIAVVKATLVLLFFMHLRWSDHLIKVVALAGFFWLAIMLVLTITDYYSRHWLL